MLLSEGQMSDYRGAALMLKALPKAKAMLADKGYDADWFRKALADRRITACIPSKANRKVPIPHDAVLYKQRHKIENMFGRLKDWRHSHSIRPLRPHLLLKHMHSSGRHLLALISES
jgi:transposase